ncbi:hypothetical protein C8R46DRAFT_1279120 [Mycena filopes]|nr:hypothetical protein C8R46DRAFT_1279120 [Mycena filopes]
MRRAGHLCPEQLQRGRAAWCHVLDEHALDDLFLITSWQTLVFDGQIWVTLDLHAFPLLPKSLLLRIARTASSFVQDINVAGHVNLHSGTLIEVTDSFSVLSVRSGSLPFMHLTGIINLRGCSTFTTRSLHHLLIQSRALVRLCFKGLAAVTNTTGGYCTLIEVLSAAAAQGAYLPLKDLRLSGLRRLMRVGSLETGRCDRPLCTYQYYAHNRGASLEYEIIQNPGTVDMLVSLTYSFAADGALDEALPVGMALRVPAPDQALITTPASTHPHYDTCSSRRRRGRPSTLSMSLERMAWWTLIRRLSRM